MSVFQLDSFIKQQGKSKEGYKGTQISNDNQDNLEAFTMLCEQAKEHINKLQETNSDVWLDRQKKAILGYPKEVQYYIKEINNFIHMENKENTKFPSWYDSLDEAIFHENWGLAGIYEWIKDGKSSSCKVIQPRIYFLKNGKTELQQQQLSLERFEKLKEILLLNDTSKRKNAPYQEIYMIDGTRIEIYNNTKEGTIIFRRYIVDNYTFENLSALGSIDEQSIPLLKSMVNCGFNVNMIGPVRSGKTTFLTTYQSYEDPTREGVLVETDPEIPLHKIMPSAPIIQMVADDEQLENILKPLMRSDGEYLIMGEARDGRALRVLLMITKKGTRRVKGTFHTGNAEDFCYDIAQEIVNHFGGDVWAYMVQAAKGFHYLFEFNSLAKDKSQKRLTGIYEIRLNPTTLQVSTHKICDYDTQSDDWTYCYDISEQTENDAIREAPEDFKEFSKTLKTLAEQKPMTKSNIVISPFSQLVPAARGN